MQTVETDGAVAAKAFTTASNQTYLFIVNGGSVGRYETKSRLYKVSANGTLTVVGLCICMYFIVRIKIKINKNVCVYVSTN